MMREQDRSWFLATSVAAVLAVVIVPACGGGESATGSDGDGSHVPGDAGAGAGAGADGGASTGGGSSSSGSASSSGGFGGNQFTGTHCLNGGTACSDCEDNDDDGLIDAFDPECTGPADDDEGTFATGIPGDNIDFCQDCFFDANSGHGDDDCQYNTQCLYGENPGGNSACHNCDVSATCRNNCAKFTPNGCDCFGCCEVFAADGERHTVLLEASCTIEKVDDPEACQACVPSDQCGNDCGECEICIGKTELPESCGDGEDEPPAPECPGDQQSCDQDTPCPAGEYCLTGCCVTTVILK